MSGAATPHAPASARASLPPTGSATLAMHALPPASSASTGLPPPTTFDILPDLHKLLKRIIDAPPADPSSQTVPADGPLEIQHVATAATDIRLKMQRAQRAVMSLPEIDRTCEDQEDEIDDLEARIARLKAALRALGQPAETTEHRDTRRTSGRLHGCPRHGPRTRSLMRCAYFTTSICSGRPSRGTHASCVVAQRRTNSTFITKMPTSSHIPFPGPRLRRFTLQGHRLCQAHA